MRSKSLNQVKIIVDAPKCSDCLPPWAFLLSNSQLLEFRSFKDLRKRFKKNSLVIDHHEIPYISMVFLTDQHTPQVVRL